MPLRIITGRAGTGKSTACLNEMKDRPAILIVPEQYSFHMGKELLRDTAVTGFDGTQVCSFRRLASLLEGEVAGRTREVITGGEKNLLLAQLVIKNKGKFELIKPGLSSVGELGEIITELKKYEVSPKALRQVYEETEDSLLRRKLADILLLYEAYESLPKLDGEDRFHRLADNVLGSETIRSHEIYLDQFTGFSPQELSVIGNLIRTAPRVTVILTMDESGEAPFETIRETRNDLRKVAAKAGEAVSEERYETNRIEASHPALACAEREFFRYPHREFSEEPKELFLFAAKDPLREITHVAAGITRLIKSGYRYSDMVIMGRSINDYQLELTEELGRFGIPYFLDRKLPLIRHRVGTAIRSALSALCHGWNSELIFRYLKCGYSSLSREEIDSLENYVLAAGIRGSAWYREEAWDMPFGTYAADDYPQPEEEQPLPVDAWRRCVAEPLARLYERIKGEHTVKEDTEALLSFLEEIGLARKLEEEAREGGRGGEEDAQIYEALRVLFHMLCHHMGEIPVRPDEFYTILEVGLAQSSVGSIPHSIDHVQISDITRAKGMGAKVVFLIGVADGVFPQMLSGQGFFSDRNRAHLAEAGIRLAPDSRARAYMEQNLVYSALTAASERLYVSYPVTAADGSVQTPSRVVERLKQIFPKLKEENDFSGIPEEDRITTAKGTFQTMLTALQMERDGILTAPAEFRSAAAWYREEPEWSAKLQAANRMREETAVPTRLSAETTREMFGTHLRTSISRLETYRKCPFRYFAEYGLSLKERKTSEMNALDTGSFLHKIFEEFSRSLEFHGIRWAELTDEELSARLEDVLPDILRNCNAYLLRESPRLAVRFQRLRKTAKVSLETVRSHFRKGTFEPLGYELTFEQNGDLAPITVTLPQGSVTLRGKIDRADRVETESGVYYRVIDYKSGKQEFDLSEVYAGISLQLMVYMDTLLQNRQKEGERALPAALAYYRLTDPVVKADPEIREKDLEEARAGEMKLDGLIITEQDAMQAMDAELEEGSSTVASLAKSAGGTYRCTAYTKKATAEQYELLREHVRTIIREIAEEMMGGNIEATPCRKGRETPCTFCSHHAVCGFDSYIDKYRYNEIKDLGAKEIWERLEGQK